MRFTEIVLVAVCLATLVKSLPIPENNPLRWQPSELILEKENSDTADFDRSKRAINALKQFFPRLYQSINPDVRNEVPDESGIDIAGSENNEVRVPYEDADVAANEAVGSDITPLDNLDVSEDENRNKRSGLDGGGGGSGGGSGNFIFDIIRLVAGSGSSSSGGDDHSGTAAKHETEEAVPGPATRLLVIANRGLSNFMQDLILRLAATSERFVNFKARLITSII